MENSENKSLISTGSSNLAKTEKLLSITQKILSEIKPKYESVRIGNQEWMTRNLDVDRFRNGDLIPLVELYEEWEKAGENGEPASCYYDNNPDNGKKYGKLYNWHAVNDPRGLAPGGWHVPTVEEWAILEKFLGENFAGTEMKSHDGWEAFENEYGEIQDGNGCNSSKFNALPSGYCSNGGRFFKVNVHAFFWSSTKLFNTSAHYRQLRYNSDYLNSSNESKSFGASVRCLKDSSDSNWVQAVKNGTIKPYIPPGLKLK
jgi:uncharacterized protein (TIGR02145 family)